MDNKGTRSPWWRFFIPIVLILALQAAAPHFFSVSERDVPPPGLDKLPYELGKWRAHGDELLDRNVTEYLKPDEYVLRDYVDPSSNTPVNLFVAYFKSLQNSWGPHSPATCLPGAGWLVRSEEQIRIEVPGQAKSIPVNKFVLEKSANTILVFYWYQNNRRIWADEYMPKLKLLDDLARFRRSDVSLVRLISPVRQSGVAEEPRQMLDFTRSVFPFLVERFGAAN